MSEGILLGPVAFLGFKLFLFGHIHAVQKYFPQVL